MDSSRNSSWELILSSRSTPSVVRGFLGLYPIEGGQAAFGNVRLHVLVPRLKSLLKAEELQVRIELKPPSELGQQDRAILEKSLSAADHARCKAALEGALKSLEN